MAIEATAEGASRAGLQRFRSPRELFERFPPKLALIADAARLVRFMLERAVPPLHAEDVIPIAAEEIAGHRLVPTLSPQERINSFARIQCEVLAAKICAESCESLARSTGFLPGIWLPRALSEAETTDYVAGRYHRWMHEVLQPSIEAAKGAVPDLPPRSRALCGWHARLFRDLYRPDWDESARRLQHAYFDSYGSPRTDRNRPTRFESTSDPRGAARRGAAGALELLRRLGAETTDVMVFENDRLGIDRDRAVELIRDAIESDVRSREVAMPETVADNGDRLAREEQALDLSAEALEEIRQLRSLRERRDLLDLEVFEPALDLAESASAGATPEATVGLTYLRLLIERVGSIEDPATRAALIYEACKGGYTRAELADRCGVSARQIERKGDLAREEVERLLAKSA